MSIESEMQAELEEAMRSRDRPRLDAIRQIRTEVSNQAAEPGFSGTVDDALYRQVIARYVKKMSKARAEYEELGERGVEMTAKLTFEIDYLDRWLPQQLSEDDTRALVREAISELGVDDPQQAGRVIGHLMKGHPDELEGGLVNRLVREELAAG